MTENQTMIFFFLIYKKLKKACVALKKKAQKSAAKAHFYKGASLLRKKPQRLYALRISALLTTLLLDST